MPCGNQLHCAEEVRSIYNHSMVVEYVSNRHFTCHSQTLHFPRGNLCHCSRRTNVARCQAVPYLRLSFGAGNRAGTSVEGRALGRKLLTLSGQPLCLGCRGRLLLRQLGALYRQVCRVALQRGLRRLHFPEQLRIPGHLCGENTHLMSACRSCKEEPHLTNRKYRAKSNFAVGRVQCTRDLGTVPAFCSIYGTMAEGLHAWKPNDLEPDSAQMPIDLGSLNL